MSESKSFKPNPERIEVESYHCMDEVTQEVNDKETITLDLWLHTQTRVNLLEMVNDLEFYKAIMATISNDELLEEVKERGITKEQAKAYLK